MRETAKLAERHAREWEAAAAHADDLVAARARAEPDAPPAMPLDDQVARAVADRADCERTLARMQRQPFESLAETLAPPDAHKGVLARIAEQLDLVIATMFDHEEKDPSHEGEPAHEGR